MACLTALWDEAEVILYTTLAPGQWPRQGRPFGVMRRLVHRRTRKHLRYETLYQCRTGLVMSEELIEVHDDRQAALDRLIGMALTLKVGHPLAH